MFLFKVKSVSPAQVELRCSLAGAKKNEAEGYTDLAGIEGT